MDGRTTSEGSLAIQARTGWRLPVRLVMVATLVAISGMLVGIDSAAAAGSGGLSYPPALLQPLPDAGASGAGVTEGSVGCPHGHPHPTGGGVKIEGSDPNLDLEIHSTSPGISNASWNVQANNSSGSDAQMTTYAICATGQYVYPSVTLSVAAGHTGAAKVSCPAGTRVVGGGVATIDGDHSVEVGASEPADGHDANHKPDDAWFGIANNGTGVSLHMEVDAVCARHGSYKVIVGARKPLPTGAIVTSVVLCPQGTRVTGGGIDIDGANLDLEVHDGFPIDGNDVDGLPDDGWQTTAYNDDSGRTAHTKAFAICKRV